MRFKRFTAVASIACIALAFIPASGAAASESRKVSAWLPWWDSRGLENFAAHADLYDQVLPFWYEMRSAKSVVSYPGADDPAVVGAARAAGVAVLPTITNDFDSERLHTMLSTDALIDAHVQVLTDIAKRFDGIDVDYENGYSTDRSRFTTFTRRLAASVHAAGKYLSMTVHPKTSEPGSWDGPQSQNWAAIGEVADRVRVMAYDYHWATSAAGGVAPLSWVREVAAFATSVIPAGKVNLGMPLYGYDWAGKVGEGVTWEYAEARRKQHGATLQHSSDGAEPWFTYNSGGTSRTVWYSDAKSTAAKLKVVDTYGLQGLTFWRLGGEDPAVWTTVRSWLSMDLDQPDVTPPTPVRDLMAKAGRRSVGLTWGPSSDASPVRYQIWRATKSNGTASKIAVVSVSYFSDTGLPPNRNYWYSVRPVDSADNRGEMSPRVWARTY